MRARNVILSTTLFLASVLTLLLGGCISYAPVTFRVEDYNTHIPIEGARVNVGYMGVYYLDPFAIPQSAQGIGISGPDGRVTLRVYHSPNTILEATAPEYTYYRAIISATGTILPYSSWNDRLGDNSPLPGVQGPAAYEPPPSGPRYLAVRIEKKTKWTDLRWPNGIAADTVAAQLKIGMTRAAAEELINQARRGDSFYWSDRGIGSTNTRFSIGDGVALWLTFGPPHDPLNPSPDDTITAVKIAHLDDLKPKVSPELFNVLHLINNSPSGAGLTFNPIALIQCVNRFHALGKEKAIQVMREYAQFAEWTAMWASDKPDNYDEIIKFDLDAQRIFLIARLLFVRTDGNPEMPDMSWMGVGSSGEVPRDVLKDNHFPLYPLAVESGIPFDMSAGMSIAGGDPNPLEILDYCEKNCVLRKELLSPTASPMDAANALFNSALWKQLFKNRPPENEYGAEEIVKIQALRSLEDLFDGENFIGKTRDAYLVEATWTKYTHDKRSQNLKWDSVKQAFIQAQK